MSKSAFTDAHKSMVETLIAARHASGLKQAELSALLGKDQSYISNIERGQRRVDVLEFYMLARMMNIDPVALYGEVVARLPDRFEV